VADTKLLGADAPRFASLAVELQNMEASDKIVVTTITPGQGVTLLHLRSTSRCGTSRRKISRLRTHSNG